MLVSPRIDRRDHFLNDFLVGPKEIRQKPSQLRRDAKGGSLGLEPPRKASLASYTKFVMTANSHHI